MKKFSPSLSRSATGFSLVELLVSMTILTAIMLLFVGILDQTQKTWNYAEGQISQFREARVAFDLMTKSISQATLNTYYEQVDKNGDGVPEDYIPKSELHFITMRAEDLRPGSRTSSRSAPARRFSSRRLWASRTGTAAPRIPSTPGRTARRTGWI